MAEYSKLLAQLYVIENGNKKQLENERKNLYDYIKSFKKII